MAKEKKLSLQEMLASIEKDYGKGSVIGGTDCEGYKDVISTGSLGLDLATGIGGLPLGKVVEIYGWESSGKSTIVLNVIAQAQKKGYKCLLVDGEFSFDAGYAKNLGVNVDDLLIVQVDKEGGEKAYNIAERLISTGEIQVAVIDSQNSLRPKKEMEGDIGDNKIGFHAKLVGDAVVQLMNVSGQNDCLVIFISQLREKIGVMFGSPETTQGGNALKFYAHMRLDVRKSVLKEGDEAYANKTKVKVVKNKMSAPFKTCEFNINFGTGIDVIREVIDHAIEHDIVVRAGAWYSYEGNKIGQGETSVYTLLKDNEELFLEIKNKVLEKLKQ